ncbi:unnamed protein product [Effrenium voratum]|uniref:Uncharacterized protein n=1 Tax=Effrenium voratum TaxID=2562239 RepID=A0AA36IER6_9DINO|nr:unnamed protein product [Effrenium voratum]CAJ1449255.1 unnamed protein product [Effrenium voratum]
MRTTWSDDSRLEKAHRPTFAAWLDSPKFGMRLASLKLSVLDCLTVLLAFHLSRAIRPVFLKEEGLLQRLTSSLSKALAAPPSARQRSRHYPQLAGCRPSGPKGPLKANPKRYRYKSV